MAKPSKTSKPAPTEAQLESMFDALADYMRKNGPMSHKDLARYENEHWLTDHRPERRNEKNRIQRFVAARTVHYSVQNYEGDLPRKKGENGHVMYRLPDQDIVVPEGYTMCVNGAGEEPLTDALIQDLRASSLAAGKYGAVEVCDEALDGLYRACQWVAFRINEIRSDRDGRANYTRVTYREGSNR